jgi:hypothetical protein
MPFNPFKGCITSDSKIKIILTSNCFRKKKIVFNINTDENNMEDLFEEIKKVIEKYNK